jgi:hypothetical protein
MNRIEITEYRSGSGRFTARIEGRRTGAVVEAGATISGYFDARTGKVALPFGERDGRRFDLLALERVLAAAHADETE